MLIENLTDEINRLGYKHWSFAGSIVDWYYFAGQIMVKDFDIITSDSFEPKYTCPTFGPRTSHRFMGRAIDVFGGEPSPTIMPTIDERIEKIKWLQTIYADRQDRYELLLQRYEAIKNGEPITSPRTEQTSRIQPAKSCTHRGEELRTMTSDLCGTRGHQLPVYACGLHGECTHRQICHRQEVRACVGCTDGPWAPI